MQPFLGNRAGGYAHRSLACAGTAAAAMIPKAVLLRVGVIGMTGTEGLGDVAIVLAALVLVADQEGDGGAGGFAFEYAGEDFYRIRLAALGDMARSARLAPVQIELDVLGGNFQSRRAAIHHATKGRAMGFTEGSDAK